MTEQFRTEKDSMGEFQVPIDANYGASTARAVENFPISNLKFTRSFIRALGEIKKACAYVNLNHNLLNQEIAEAIIREIKEDLGITVLLVEHDMNLVMSISDRICVLDSGEIIALGEPEEIKNHPKVIETYLGETADA